MNRRDSGDVHDAVAKVAAWLLDESAPEPDRAALGAAVRLTARTLAQVAPGGSVELRVPPFVAVQCISGLRHTRGTPPNVVEVNPRVWLLLATGLIDFATAGADGGLTASGPRAAHIAAWLPLLTLPPV
ncbi:sterol carrier family protein [Mycolicibacterium sp.]|uniref:sterol carrier family protein n=1 Tax=Mycolicibacterium sp. TaxID=2320850 RepID=UPI0028B10A1C|nr:sterol carrier family protein [Mycolicibacterium sp.]